MKRPFLDSQLHHFLQWVEAQRHDRLAIVMDKNTERDCLPLLLPLLPPHTDFLCLTAVGEDIKSLEHAHAVWSHLDQSGFTRQSALVALGGGTVTDLTGFIADTFLRGIDCWLIPTSLLGMVDAAIGGKTGINLAGAKNRVGTFHEPAGISLNPHFLKTLDERQIRAGLAEHVKHLLLTRPEAPTDGSMGHWMMDGESLDVDRVAEGILESVSIKSDIVDQDQRERTGARKVLNFGHTSGHALESWALQQGLDLLHGEAVAWGMRVALLVSAHRCTSPLAAERLRNTSHWLGLHFPCPVNPPSVEDLWPWMRMDKKNEAQQVLMVLLDDLGQPVLDQPVEQEEWQRAFSVMDDGQT